LILPGVTAESDFKTASGGHGLAYLVHAVHAVSAFVEFIFVGRQNAHFGSVAHLGHKNVALTVGAAVDH